MTVRSKSAPPAVTHGHSVSYYLSQIRKFPMLEPEREYMLAKAWAQNGDTEAAHQLVTSHLRLAAKIAMGYRSYGLPMSEIISEANIGLMQAVRRFDPEKGFRLATYAMWWIRASIQEYVLRSWSLVKIGTTAAQKKLFFGLKSAKNRIGALDNTELQPGQAQKIASDLGVREDEVISMNRRMSGNRDSSLNARVKADGESATEWQEWLVDDNPTQEESYAERDEFDQRMQLLNQAMEKLNEREIDIFKRRKLNDKPETLSELAKVYGVSRERIRQIEVAAFTKIQKEMQKLAEQRGMSTVAAD